ncbi:methyltransferase domain-containing protein [Sutcliffiella sp. NC1]|uniref:methyltransferase domain-containing protein n=1 Tax=Sutcliffiella sp. NC1 TaxID=3004096 RepID=UPI0022DE3412|nr:methyltransferase domain-containing protein [Sutcliffiella sp. NC1]WBL14539.1 methyltransferase domain-containing protein [Sutcliffiella sp. NC1]
MDSIEHGVRDQYWADRNSMMYYKYVDYLVRAFAADAKSIIDVGTANTKYIESFTWIPNKYSLDIKNPYSSSSVKGIEMDFLKFEPKEKFDFVTCLQVLEHIPNVEAFAQKLLSISDKVLISVPYNWPAGSEDEHIHDPIDLDKLNKWMGKEPTYYIIVEEPLRNPVKRKNKRLICYYQTQNINFGEARSTAKRIRGNNMESKQVNGEEFLKSNFESIIRHQQINNEIIGAEIKTLILKEKIELTIKNNILYRNKIQQLEKEKAIIEKSLNKEYRERKMYDKKYKKITVSRLWRLTLPLRKIGDIIKLKF